MIVTTLQQTHGYTAARCHPTDFIFLHCHTPRIKLVPTGSRDRRGWSMRCRLTDWSIDWQLRTCAWRTHQRQDCTAEKLWLIRHNCSSTTTSSSSCIYRGQTSVTDRLTAGCRNAPA